jgi:P27 family predicted phage terminase small subunit
MPKTLSSLAADRWREMVRTFSARGTLTRGDGPALEIYVVTWARWVALVKEIDEVGPMVTVEYAGADGQTFTKRTQNPACKLAAQLEVSMRQMLKEFSATPASREKAKPAKPAAKPNKEPKPGTVGWLLAHADEEETPPPETADDLEAAMAALDATDEKCDQQS